MTEERRQFHRISFDAPAELSQNNLHGISEIIDISLKGILIKSTDLPFDHDLPVSISIRLNHETYIEMTADWSNSKNNADAYHWTQVDIESLSTLRRLLELNTGNEDLIERELSKLGTFDN